MERALGQSAPGCCTAGLFRAYEIQLIVYIRSKRIMAVTCSCKSVIFNQHVVYVSR